jgi:hypothetical protein
MDEGEKNEIWAQLAPSIRFWARLTAKNRPWLRREFVEDAVSKVYEKFEQFDPKRGGFRTWVGRILYHELKDRCKRDSRHTAFLSQFEDDRLSSRRSLPKRNDDEPFRLTEADWDRVRGWPTRARVHLLLVCGNLWMQAPSDEWKSWLAEVGLPDDFPPSGFDEIDNLPDRNAALAEAFGVTRALINQWLSRSKRFLSELECPYQRLS